MTAVVKIPLGVEMISTRDKGTMTTAGNKYSSVKMLQRIKLRFPIQWSRTLTWHAARDELWLA